MRTSPAGVQLKYKEAAGRSGPSALFHRLAETPETAHAREAGELLSEVTEASTPRTRPRGDGRLMSLCPSSPGEVQRGGKEGDEREPLLAAARDHRHAARQRRRRAAEPGPFVCLRVATGLIRGDILEH